MRIVGLSDQDQQAVFSIVASVMHLGNIEFVAGPTGEDCTVGNQGTLAIVAELLGVSLEKLSTALLTRTIQTVGETIVKPLHKVAATESRDALAKTLYGALFDWLVAAVNRRIATLGERVCLLPASGNHAVLLLA
jgi:myosin-5